MCIERNGAGAHLRERRFWLPFTGGTFSTGIRVAEVVNHHFLQLGSRPDASRGFRSTLNLVVSADRQLHPKHH